MKSLFRLFIFSLFLSVTGYAQSETDKGIELYRNGDFDGAITILQKVVETNEIDRKAWTYLGASFGKIKKSEDAYKAFRNADSISIKHLSPNELSIFNDGLKITAKPRANYTDMARSNGVQGQVRLAVEFLKDGKIGFIIPVNTLRDGLTEQCIVAARKIKFEPAQRNGNPVLVVGIIAYNFTIY